MNEQINRLLNVFKSHVPTTDERYPGMVREYAEALTRFPPSSLKAGVSWMIARRKEKFWPTPAELIQAIEEAVDADRFARLPRPKKSEDPRTEGRIEIDQEKLWTTRVGQVALSERWGAQLLDSLETGETRSIEEANGKIEWFRNERRLSIEALKSLPGNSVAPALSSLFNAMLDREDRLAAKWLKQRAA